ncbi:glycoside hydrolase family 76 protein [Sphingobacterium mizutaii]|uniref:glycoside hydrolase family 76 protein n=1 Tax=Sphingobacterium mizutaii TaxID=1010 RepID=UPI00162679DD|nr:glycoside hydrolase family 76 protein [Sphingobacterium mizutaii]
MKKTFILTVICFMQLVQVLAQPNLAVPSFAEQAAISLDSIYKHYGIKGEHLLRENFPYDDSYKASYLAGPDEGKKGNAYSYLWPFSGSLSAQVARYELHKDPKILKEIKTKVLPGLEHYYDKREPYGYASYVKNAPLSDRFYDDNVWLGIDFADLYLNTKDKKFLAKSEEIWRFVESGMDDILGGGIYWCEQKKESKNTCSNAPAVVYLLKLYEATNKRAYLEKAEKLFQWTKEHLEDPVDHLYFDNISLTGKVNKTKFPYNSGQMLQSAALFYKITKDQKYLKEAQEIAASAHEYFFQDKALNSGKKIKLFKNSDSWFIAVMLRGFVELYHADKNPLYINSFKDNLRYAWTDLRDEHGLFNKDWKGEKKSAKKWLLDQLAMVEMYARIASI